MLRRDALFGAGLPRLGAKSVPGAVQRQTLPGPPLVRQRLRTQQRGLQSIRIGFLHRRGFHISRGTKRHRSTHLQLLPRLLRPRQLLHVPCDSGQTYRMETHIQNVNWGSSTQAQTYTSAIKALQRLNDVREHVKNYRPQLLVLCGRPSVRPPLLDLGYLLTKNVSLLLAGDVEMETLSHKARACVVRSGDAWLRRHNIRAFVTTVDGCGEAEDGNGLLAGAKALVQVAGVGKMRPNILLIGYKANWQTMGLDHHLGLVLLRNGDFLDYSSILDDDHEAETIEAAVRSSTPAPITPQPTPMPPRKNGDNSHEEDSSRRGNSSENSASETRTPPKTPEVQRNGGMLTLDPMTLEGGLLKPRRDEKEEEVYSQEIKVMYE
ncbi:hypothetical protein J437_LFUL007270 [Ladona fulva]|uniref:SLC12A transporter C-terminal domain-containing protein n=1 Tax=Ladona fulva TaxID=123851 RepID=A0A8K0NYW3_LADFU|nr:hypothetical protein J437_LFUL007270 [Ladona fulva]